MRCHTHSYISKVRTDDISTIEVEGDNDKPFNVMEEFSTD